MGVVTRSSSRGASAMCWSRVEGRRMKGIAAILDLSARTVETGNEMMRVPGVRSTAELVALAIKGDLAETR